MEGRALPMVFSPSTCPLPLSSAARPRYYGFCGGLVGEILGRCWRNRAYRYVSLIEFFVIICFKIVGSKRTPIKKVGG